MLWKIPATHCETIVSKNIVLFYIEGQINVNHFGISMIQSPLAFLEIKQLSVCYSGKAQNWEVKVASISVSRAYKITELSKQSSIFKPNLMLSSGVHVFMASFLQNFSLAINCRQPQSCDTCSLLSKITLVNNV